ncbi:MAG TPA: hypothetical protein IAA80_04180 [Candidatus Gallacutalibacter pullistercoris]|nr:hypothetical protein [Candidatus Gallacutalibacter pullistercoris]
MKTVFMQYRFWWIQTGHTSRKLPIIIHGLEYAWYDIEATKNANISGEADVFLKAMNELRII